MNISSKVFLTVCAAAGVVSLRAQGVEKNVAFQYFANSGEPGQVMLRVEATTGKTVTGKPFSATEVRRTRQTLGDGTHIDKDEKDKYFRDSDGRTRIERDNGNEVIISDPGTGATAETSNGKTKVMMMRSSSVTTSSGAGAGSGAGYGFASAASGTGEKTYTVTADAPELHKEMLDKMKAEAGAASGVRVMTRDVTTRVTASAMPAEKGATEDLGDQMINGVMAHGTRSTITIPVGQIGNDREIKVVSERWFSNDLGLLIKSTNNDPRFGETTFELMDILQGAQDPTLFQMPNSGLPGNRK